MSITTSIRIRKAGGSLIATIPKEVVDSIHLRPGQEIQATFEVARPTLDGIIGLCPELGPWDRSWTRGRDRL